MASFVGAFAASHGPLLVREWEAVPSGEKSRLKNAFDELGRRLKSANPDVLIVVSPDHWSNFFLDNYPAVCLGVGAANEGPPEPWMKGFAHRDIPGHPALALHIAEEAMRGGFEPSVSHHLKLDHGACIPLWRMGLEKLPKIVPMLLNSIEPPMPSLRRCLEWGRLLATAIENYKEDIRVAVLGTGGLSHSIGEPTMGAIYEDFDHETIRLFSSSEDSLISYLEDELPRRGNGSEEVRNWLVAHGAAGGRGFELVDYLPVPTVIVGCGFASWRASRP
ncbi:MAG TPA: 2,3-dihydroxyphenylpropionate 1,2-dioxygenase [Burkholderiales bacterium]|jgi:aromatic ring-opening dioxygenase catalytic subunit (LigB family)|nr:2,3-dihydroxyphenylpropionate 1,2-dioxygenase [Burkholderiales bacterium]